MKKGFSVFTPMVGTILITITVLIVASILQSERFAVAGTMQSYESIKIANIMREAKSRIEEEIRVQVFKKALANSNVLNDSCYNDDIIANYGWGTPKCEDIMEDITLKEIIAKLRDTLGNESMSNVVDNFASAYSEQNYKLEYNNDPVFRNKLREILPDDGVQPHSDGKRVKVKLDFSKIYGYRVATLKTNTSSINIYLDPEEKEFVSRDPILLYAKSIGNMFKKLTLMNDDWHEIGGVTNVINYHGSEGAISDSGGTQQGHGDGRKWYHYKYVLQARKPPKYALTGGYITTGWQKGSADWSKSHGFEYANNNNQPVVLHESLDQMLGKIGGVIPKIEVFSSDSTPVNSDCPTDILKKKDIDKFSKFLYSNSHRGAQTNTLEDHFIAGYLKGNQSTLRLDMGSYYSDKSFFDDVWDPLKYGGSCAGASTHAAWADEHTAMPGGHITASLFPTGNWLPTKDLCTDRPPPYGVATALDNPLRLPWADYLTNMKPHKDSSGNPRNLTVVDTIKDYDGRYEGGGMEDAIDKIETSLNAALNASMGFGGVTDPAKKLKYKLVVRSWQYYTLRDNITGGDNWQCGELMAWYVPKASPFATPPPGPDVECASDLIKYIDNIPGFTLDEDDVFFASLPFNYTCPTFVLVAVKEEITLYRNNNTHPDGIVHLVSRATFTRRKDNYAAGGPDVDNLLWEGSPIDATDQTFLTTVLKPQAAGIMDDKLAIRRCTYTYKSGDVDVERKCGYEDNMGVWQWDEWIGVDPKDDMYIRNPM